MAVHQPKHMNSMYEQRIDEIISQKDGKPTFRIARFLKPSSKNLNFVADFPKTPFLYEVFTQKKLKKWPFEVHFTGWKKPQKNWERWYYKLVVNHGTNWLKAGIIDALNSSVHEIRCNNELVLGVCEFWCSSTNTFVFPWGEATITLEDVMVLGGFPALGKSVLLEIGEELAGIVDGLEMAKREISNKGVSHSDWMKHFMKEEEEEEEEDGEICDEEGEFEHVAFLALWLSRFVFPGTNGGGDLIKNIVFPIAAHLSKGTPISIAPIVLANLYNDMTLLAKNATDPCFDSKKVRVSGLFQIVQLWVYERFPVFAENLAKPLCVGDPRVARWDNVDVRVKLPFVRSVLKVGEGFRWRPYADGLRNWEILPFYEDEEQLLDDVKDLPCSDLPSFGWFCRSCELVGVTGKVWYNPHRVAMQFGFDQDLPEVMTDPNPGFDQIGFPVPSRNFEPGITRSYYHWWEEAMLCHRKAVCKALRLNRRNKKVDEGHRPDQENADCSDFPWHMQQVQPVVDAPAMCDLLASVGNQLRKDPSSLEEGKNCADPESPRTVVIMSPGVSKSNSRESHGSVSPNATFLLRKCISQNTSDVSSHLDDVSLALRICTKKVTMETHSHELAQVSNHGSRSSNNKTVVPLAADDEPPDSYDIDHVPLALRLQTLVESKGTLKQVESYASTVNVGNPQRRQLSTLTEELPSPTSDADSQVTKIRSSLSKTSVEKDKKLEVRVAKLERFVAKLEATQCGPKFSVSD